MLNITFLIGPPASGKTFIARQMMSMFPEHRTIVASWSDKKRLSSILKHREFYNAICIEEADNRILAKLEEMIVMHSTDIYDPVDQTFSNEKTGILNILVCGQKIKITDSLNYYRYNWRHRVNINIINLPKPYAPC